MEQRFHLRIEFPFGLPRDHDKIALVVLIENTVVKKIISSKKGDLLPYVPVAKRLE